MIDCPPQSHRDTEVTQRKLKTQPSGVTVLLLKLHIADRPTGSMSRIQTDFDRIALVSPDGSLHNHHYSDFLLRQLHQNCQSALEIGCGKGEFSRRLAERSWRVLALDLSPEMIRIARANSATESNIEFQIADVMTYDLPAEGFDCIASIATLHHLPLPEILGKMKAALKPGGRPTDPRSVRTSRHGGPTIESFSRVSKRDPTIDSPWTYSLIT